MAKYHITHACGCTITHQLCGPTKDRARKESWLESQPCRECERKAINEASAARAEAAGLPALEGSEKQVAWATTIRDKALPEMAKLKLKGHPKLSDAAQAEVADAIILITTEIERQTDASWWIEHRAEMSADFTIQTWIGKQMVARGLTPTADAEVAAINAARAAKQ